jgi:hypothetical protein
VEDNTKESVIELERNAGDAMKSLPGKKIGDTMDVELEEFLGFGRSAIVKDTLGLEEDPAPGQPLTYKVTITSIKASAKDTLDRGTNFEVCRQGDAG